MMKAETEVVVPRVGLRRLVVTAALALAVLANGCASSTQARFPINVRELHSISDLQARFNADAGRVPLVADLTYLNDVPRWRQLGAEGDLGEEPSRQPPGVWVWVPFLGASSESANLSERVLPDSRVIQYWDGAALTSEWFAKNVEHSSFPAWDVYFL